MWSLLVSIAPLCVVGAVSPVIFLNASSVYARGGVGAALRFLAGILTVLLLLGVASMGLLGTAAATEAEREIASRAVDRFLGLLLGIYGGYLLVQFVRKHEHPASVEPPRQQAEFVGGFLGMATNFTTLPIFMSVGQRIGASGVPMIGKVLIVVLAAGVVAAPAWLPMALHRFTSGGDLSAKVRSRITNATSIISIAACGLGAIFLLVHGV
ncbi:hypothetical protein BJY21_003847 [Kineosphaera limosa]|uniref:Uncharacterized protein n=1 Tax=Kineosphaera limosa NBRC 100340 TaxID=1184609 RepID=K6VNF2_9MICO|nr:hypothetical protein [Kineosphaera limosa]NYE02663.1 hypothetical protein [Kineosphaera limosa]GAB97753.1 hypothetical protein KILIM_080_00240 [Kineosphaera limosa NBRC 100340]